MKERKNEGERKGGLEGNRWILRWHAVDALKRTWKKE